MGEQLVLDVDLREPLVCERSSGLVGFVPDKCWSCDCKIMRHKDLPSWVSRVCAPCFCARSRAGRIEGIPAAALQAERAGRAGT